MNLENLNKNKLTIEDVIIQKGEEWRKAIDIAQNSVPEKYLSSKNLLRLIKGKCTLVQFQLMTKLFYIDYKSRPIGITAIEQFFFVVDRSEYSLYDWLEGILLFYNWPNEKHQSASFFKILGYLQCCEDSPENKMIPHNFNDLIREMIVSHGFVG